MNSLINTNMSPIIISGMHRSGTSLLSRKLIDMKVFLGSYQDNNNESIFFQRLNRWIMSCVGSSWDKPKSFYNVNDLTIIERRLKNSLNSKSLNFIYFGIYKALLNHNFSNINYLWGWKDPSNTFTLPIWRNFFPNCKVIYVVRHPLDVSLSLFKRNNNLKKAEFYKDKSSFFSKYLSLLSISHGGVSCSLNINSIDDCLRLYNVYYAEIAKFNGNNILFVKYEDLLLNPEDVFSTICAFINIKLNKDLIKKFSKDININRAYAFKNNNSFKYSKVLLKNTIYYEK